MGNNATTLDTQDLDDLIKSLEDQEKDPDPNVVAKAMRTYAAMLDGEPVEKAGHENPPGFRGKKTRSNPDADTNEEAPPFSNTTHDDFDGGVEGADDDDTCTDMDKLNLERGRASRSRGRETSAPRTGYGKSYGYRLDDLETDAMEKALTSTPGGQELYDAERVVRDFCDESRDVRKAINDQNEAINAIGELAYETHRMVKSLASQLRQGGTPARQPETPVADESITTLAKSALEGLREIRARMDGVEKAVNGTPHSPHPQRNGNGAAPQQGGIGRRFGKSLDGGQLHLSNNQLAKAVKGEVAAGRMDPGQGATFCKALRYSEVNDVPVEEAVATVAPQSLKFYRTLVNGGE